MKERGLNELGISFEKPLLESSHAPEDAQMESWSNRDGCLNRRSAWYGNFGMKPSDEEQLPNHNAVQLFAIEFGAHGRTRTAGLILTNNALCPGTVSIPNANFSAISRVTNLNFAAAWRGHPPSTSKPACRRAIM